VLLTAAGFGAGGHAMAQDVVNVGITNVATDVAFFLAEEKGYFADENIAVTFQPFASAANMIAPLGAGQLDVGGGGIAAGFYNAVGRGIDIKIVGDKGSINDTLEYSTLVIRKDLVDSGKYSDLSDLKGLTVATAAQGANSESQLNEAAKKGGVAYDDINVVYLAFPEMYAALQNGAVDGAVTNEPTLTRLLHDGVAVKAGKEIIYPGQQVAVILYSDDFAERRKDVAQRFMRAYVRGARDYNDALVDGSLAGPQGNDVIAALVENTAIKDEAVYRGMTPFVFNPDARVSLASLVNDLAFYKSRGLVPDDAAIEPYVDMSFVDAALADLGPYVPK
jgi:NitT/TauT family transport system substrate-binding protein